MSHVSNEQQMSRVEEKVVQPTEVADAIASTTVLFSSPAGSPPSRSHQAGHAQLLPPQRLLCSGEHRNLTPGHR